MFLDQTQNLALLGFLGAISQATRDEEKDLCARVSKGMGGFGSIWVELFGFIWVGKLVGMEGLLVEGSEVDGEVCGVYGSGRVVLKGGVVLMDDSFGVVGGVVSGVSVVTLGDSVLGLGVEG
ncbi:hypothetical protein Tco_0649635 [Tanacetum coccineum]